MSSSVGGEVGAASSGAGDFDEHRLVSDLEAYWADALHFHVRYFDAEGLELGARFQIAWGAAEGAKMELCPRAAIVL